MPPRRLRDRRAGALPVIRPERDSVVFHLEIAGIRPSRLVIRCDEDGNVWASLCNPASPDEGGFNQRS